MDSRAPRYAVDVLIPGEFNETHVTPGQSRLAKVMAATLHRVAVRPILYLWVYVLVVIVAELIITFVSASLGLALQALMLIALLLHGAAGPPGPQRNITLALTLVPLTRLLSLSLPLATFPRLEWYPVVTVPLMIAWWEVVRFLGLTHQELYLRSNGLAFQLALAGGGLGLGVIEYRILRPPLLVANATFDSLLIAALVLMVFTGFTEELIFRGLLQHLTLQALGHSGLIYVSLLFAALYIGNRSFELVVLAFGMGLLFAIIVRCTGSILGVSVAHGLVNVTLFLIMPYVAQNPPGLVQSVVTWITSGGTTLSITVLATAAMAQIMASKRSAVRSQAIERDLKLVPKSSVLPAANDVRR